MTQQPFNKLMRNGQAEYDRIRSEYNAQSAMVLLLIRAVAVNRSETERSTGALIDLVAALEKRVTDLEARVARLEAR